MIFDYQPFYEALSKTPLAPSIPELTQLIDAALALEQHGKLTDWIEQYEQLPHLINGKADLIDAVSIIGEATPNLTEQLQLFHPWRKGPYHLYGTHIDTEWRSDWKWDRLKDQISPLDGRFVLDVGCGNGYHIWRMLGAGAKLVVGLDPLLLYVVQYWVIRKLLSPHFPQPLPGYVLPLGIEQLPENSQAFDTIFSLGVLYHRRSPIDHLIQLRDSLRPGGELILETLIIDGTLGELLLPEGRYAQMRNVWFIPTVDSLISWMKKVRFKKITVLDISTTTSEEQRSTDWMRFHSLSDFLNPEDHSQTVEGHPAPKRVILKATY